MVALVFLFFATTLITLGLEQVISYRRAVKEGFHTKATILEVTTVSTGPRRRDTLVKVEFPDSNGLPRQASYHGLGMYYAGESVQISFYKDQVYELEGLQNASHWLTLIAGICIAVGCLAYVYRYGIGLLP